MFMLFEKISTLALSPKFIILILFFIISKLINYSSSLAHNEKAKTTEPAEKPEFDVQETLDSTEYMEQFIEFVGPVEGFAWFIYFASMMQADQPMLIGVSVILLDMVQKNLLLYIKKRNETGKITGSEQNEQSPTIDPQISEVDHIETSKSTFDIIKDILDSIF